MDLLSKFDEVSADTQSLISRADLEFCKKMENEYQDLIKYFNAFIPLAKEFLSRDVAIWKSFPSVGNSWSNRFSPDLGGVVTNLRDLMKGVKEAYATSLVNYFNEKYNLNYKYNDFKFTEDSLEFVRQMLEKDGGYSFESAGQNKLKDDFIDSVYLKSAGASMVGNKIYISRHFYISSFLNDKIKLEYDQRGKVRLLQQALNYFETQKVKGGDIELPEPKDILLGETNPVLNSKSIVSFKVFKNGKLQLEFSNKNEALNFWILFSLYKLEPKKPV